MICLFCGEAAGTIPGVCDSCFALHQSLDIQHINCRCVIGDVDVGKISEISTRLTPRGDREEVERFLRSLWSGS